MQFLSSLEADGVDDQMRVDVRRICVSGNYHFVVLPLLCQFQSDGVSFLRCDIFIWMEGLHEVEIHFAAAFVVL